MRDVREAIEEVAEESAMRRQNRKDWRPGTDLDSGF